jgi:hypothetical protein
MEEKKTLNSPKEKIGVGFLGLSCHPSTFLGAAATYLCTSLAMVNIVPFTFLSTCIADVSAQIAELLCKLAVH